MKRGKFADNFTTAKELSQMQQTTQDTRADIKAVTMALSSIQKRQSRILQTQDEILKYSPFLPFYALKVMPRFANDS